VEFIIKLRPELNSSGLLLWPWVKVFVGLFLRGQLLVGTAVVGGVGLIAGDDLAGVGVAIVVGLGLEFVLSAIGLVVERGAADRLAIVALDGSYAAVVIRT
jgi:hypothetical protein